MNTTTTAPEVPRIDIPSATEDPAAYVTALLDVASGHDPFEVLATTPVKAFELCGDTPAELCTEDPEPGEWSAASVIGHLYDVDIVYGFRWRLALTEGDPSYPGYDEAKWTPLPRLPLWQSLDAWTGLRAANVTLLRNVPREDWQRTGRHGEQGSETIETMIRKVIGHDLAHLNQIYRALRLIRTHHDLDVTTLDHTYHRLTAPPPTDSTAAGRH